MTRVDFYVTAQSGALARERLACRLAAKAVKLGHRLHIHLADEAALKRLDDLLWTFSDASFLAHDALGAHAAAPVTLATGGAPQPVPELLINLADDIPKFFSNFPRVAEIISADAATRELGRERFRFYRDRGYPLQHHELGH
ncbi:MAG: DNA polymerase III subunit chi [Gammaproteobacteria bacterium]|nr:DNA polymerase III subunit chi [Gammaproteobacteria bacterium]